MFFYPWNLNDLSPIICESKISISEYLQKPAFGSNQFFNLVPECCHVWQPSRDDSKEVGNLRLGVPSAAAQSGLGLIEKAGCCRTAKPFLSPGQHSVTSRVPRNLIFSSLESGGVSVKQDKPELGKTSALGPHSAQGAGLLGSEKL